MGYSQFLTTTLASVSSADETTQVLLTFAGALVVGVLFIQLARVIRVSRIAVLLVGGVVVGPQVLNIIRPASLGDSGLAVIVSLAVGVILFEGGMTLNVKGYRSASREIKGILIAGTVITWWATALLAKLLFGFHIKICMLLGSLIIVTGPTVIGPLLKSIRVRPRLHSILHWEGVLIDPIGVFVALLCYKLVLFGAADGPMDALRDLGLRVLVGAVLGGLGGWLLAKLIEKKWIPEDNLNIVVLAWAIGLFSLSDYLMHESGVLSVTIAGFVVGYRNLPAVRKLKEYKAELIDLLIGLLFVLLAARLKFESFVALGWKGLLLVVLVVLLVRPLVILVATMRSDLKLNEKLFLSWIGPRGVVAIAMASLFAMRLAESERWGEYAEIIEAFTFSIVVVTVLFQGTTAKLVAKVLGVLEPAYTGWLIVGGHRLAREAGSFIRDHGCQVALIDPNPRATALAKRAGLPALAADVVTIDMEENPECYGVGNILAITERDEVNAMACQHFRGEQGDLNLYRWSDRELPEEAVRDPSMIVGDPVWQPLQLQNLRALEYDHDSKNLSRAAVDVGKIRHPERVLLCIYDGKITPFVPPEATGVCDILSYEPFVASMDARIRPEWVKISDAESFDELFSEMLDCLSADFPEIDLAKLHRDLVHRENDFSSLVGYDVSLPHLHTDDLDHSVVLVAKLRKPLKDLHSDDQIRYVFIVLSPQDKPKVHLQALSELSQFIMDESNRRHLENASDNESLIKVFFTER